VRTLLLRAALAIGGLWALPNGAGAVDPPSCELPGALGAPACAASTDVGSVPRAGGAEHVGNPIEIASGNKYEQAIDYRSISSPLAFTRHYNSALADENRGLGHGWRHGLDVTLARIDERRLLLIQGDGRRMTFDLSLTDGGSRRWNATGAAEGGAIRIDAGRWVWHVPDGRRLTFDRGSLLRIDYPDGELLALTRRNGRLTHVTDEHGVTMALVWADGARGLRTWDADPNSDDDTVPAGHIEAIVLPDGSRIEYRYSGAQTLVGTAHRRHDHVQPLGRYGYAKAAGVERLVSVTRPDAPPLDEPFEPTGPVTTRWRYDDEGRAVAQLDATGGERLRIERSAVDTAMPAVITGEPLAGSATVHHADGTARAYTWRARPDAQAGRHGARLRYETGASPLRPPSLANPPDTPEPAGLLGHIERIEPIPGSLDGRLPAGATRAGVELRFEATAQGRITDLRIGERTLSDLLRRHAERRSVAGSVACEPVDSPGAILQRVATAEQPCPEDLVQLEQLRKGAAAHALQGRSALRRFLDPFCELPGGKDCATMQDHYEMALLSGCVYRSGIACASGWAEVDPPSLGLDPNRFSFGDFHAELFHDDSTDRYALVFRGTDSLADLLPSIGQGAGMRTEQYDHAVALASEIDQAMALLHPGSSLEFSGHSLGGGLATAASMDQRARATVFNPSEVTAMTAARNRWLYFEAVNHIEVLRVDNEIVHDYFRLTGAPGNVTTIARPPDVRAHEQIDAHLIATVIESIGLYLDRHCNGAIP